MLLPGTLTVTAASGWPLLSDILPVISRFCTSRLTIESEGTLAFNAVAGAASETRQSKQEQG
ncbi:MAG: hypothetical protein ACN6PN_08220, partial [Sphingobacterium sp.]